jgi:hypothetical protein
MPGRPLLFEFLFIGCRRQLSDDRLWFAPLAGNRHQVHLDISE